MNRMQRILGAAVLLACVAGLAGPVRAQSGSDDPEKLANLLGRLKMTELLGQLREELGEDQGLKAMYLLAQSKISQAQKTGDPEQADKLLSEAVSILTKLVAQADAKLEKTDPKTQKEAYDELLLDTWKYRLELAMTRGETQVADYTIKVRLLYAGQADYKAIRELTKGLDDMLLGLSQDVEDALRSRRLNLRDQMFFVPDAEDFQRRLKYGSSFIRFNRASSWPILDVQKMKARLAKLDGEIQAAQQAGNETLAKNLQSEKSHLDSIISTRELLLRDASADIGTFVDDEDSGVMWRSRLLAGRVYRALGEHGEADRMLSRVTDGSVGVRLDAAFESARNQIEAGDWKQAADRIDALLQLSAKLLGDNKQAQIGTDLKEALLRNYLWDVRASAETDPAKRKEYTLKAQAALLEFADAYADNQPVLEQFMDMIAEKFRGRDDYENLPSVVLIAVGIKERVADNDPQALKLFSMVLKRDDDASKQMVPMALYHRALTHYDMGANLPATEDFMRVAKEFPKDKRAFPCARNAVITLNALTNQRMQRDGRVAPNIRMQFVEALDLLLKGWHGEEGVNKWYYDLGWQCKYIADGVSADERTKWLKRAVTAFSQVPSDLPESTEARFRRLEVGVDLLNTETDKAKRQTTAKALAEELEAYGREIHGKSFEDESFARAVREWGARAEFYAAQIMHDSLDREQRAYELLGGLAQRWPGTSVLEAGAELEIRWDFEAGRVRQAIAKLKQFEQKYQDEPERANRLRRLIIQQIRGKAEFRDTFAQFAEEIYNEAYSEAVAKAQQQGIDPARRDVWITGQTYDAKQMLAQARLGNEEWDKALALYQELSGYEQSLRQEWVDELSAKYQRRLDELQGVKFNKRRVVQMVEEFRKELVDSGLDPQELSFWRKLDQVLVYLKAVQGQPAKVARALEMVVEELTNGLKEFLEIRKRSYPKDVENLRGLAAAHEGKGNYAKALELYLDRINLIRTVNSADLNNEQVTRVQRMFWQAQLDYCRTALKGYKGQSGNMSNLVKRIERLEKLDENMGGADFAARFRAIRDEAAAAVRQAEGG